ncbi:MAG TPA: hypothetical protein DDZ80_02255 [Cyanobacteria bacterium UBA8803]|nr:hypothetical protein [Cyanobacteria bacterium UBA9273]HBL57407.1 hypothetical protein [Cyanobacteria bacterium UBA8803]
MSILRFFSSQRPSAQGFKPQSAAAKVQLDTFILEPILTPSGLMDGLDDTPDPEVIELHSEPLDLEHISTIEDILPDSSLDSMPDEELEDIPFITSGNETPEKLSTMANEPAEELPVAALTAATLDNSNPTFESGVFTVGNSGQVKIDFLFDGGSYKGELAIFSLDGMEQFEPGSEAFIREVASRALSNSELGHVVISDPAEGAKFSGTLGEGDRNSGEYLGAKTFAMRPGDKFGVMLVPNGQVQQVFDNPEVGGAVRPLFSLATANPDDAFHLGQIADVTGDGNTFVMEDLRVDGWTDRDYNDVIFQVTGATGEAVDLDDVIADGKDWRSTKLGQELLNYTELSIVQTDLIEVVDTSQDNLDTILNEQLTEFPAELDVALASPESILNEDLAELPNDLNITLDDLESVIENTVADLPETSDTNIEEFTENLPEDVSSALNNLNNTLEGKIGDISSELSLAKEDLANQSTQLNSTFDELTSAVEELKTALGNELTELPEELKTSFEEFSNLIAQGRTELIAQLESTELETIITELTAEVNSQIEAEDGSIISTATYFGQDNIIGQADTGSPPVRFEFAAANQPLVGVIDTGLSASNPDIDYSRIILGRDCIDGDDNPLLETNEGDEHGTHILGIIAATQDNNKGIDGINDDAPLWVGRAVESGQWAESLVEFVNTAKASGQPHAIVNLSFDLTQINPDGSITTRYELTPQERAAIEYARQNGVLLVVAAGNEGGAMSALGEASGEFDNIITVGATDLLEHQLDRIIAAGTTDEINRAEYSNYGAKLDILASGGTDENPVTSTVADGVGIMAGTSVATAKVTGAASQVWAANPQLNYRQVIEILKATATDLATSGWDTETGAGLLNLVAAVSMAGLTPPIPLETVAGDPPSFDSNNDIASERPVGFWSKLKKGFKKIGQAITKAVNTVVGGVKTVANNIVSAAKKVINTVANTVQQVGNKVSDAVKKTLNIFGGIVNNVINKIGDAIKKTVDFIWNGVKWVSRQLWYKLQGIFHRVSQWVTKLPKRVARLVLNIWEGVKSLKPWSVEWWKSLGQVSTWEDFGKWLGKNLIYLAEIYGAGEIYETLADFLKFTTRPLNSREIEVAKSVFGNSINYNLVRVDTKALLGPSWTGRAYVSFNTINSWGPLENDKLIHELTHVWQYQRDGAIYMPQAIHAQNSAAGYNYGGVTELQRRKNIYQGITSFNREQQASIVQDYFLIVNGKQPQYGNGTYTDLPLYAHFVKEVSTLTKEQLSEGAFNQPKLIDLSGEYFNVNPEPLNAGDYFDVEFQVQNTEVHRAGAFNVNFYLSTNNTISAYDRYLGSYLVNSLAGNSDTGTLRTRLKLPWAGDSFWNNIGDGTYYIGMIVDANNNIRETNEGNNTSTSWLNDHDDVPIYNTQQGWVTVTINRVKGDFDPIWNDSDFYSRISIAGQEWRSPTKGGSNDYRPPNWYFTKWVTGSTVPITIKLYDEDGPSWLNPDDHVDIDPRWGDKDLHLTYNLSTGQISGDVYGSQGQQIYARGAGDSSRGEIWFTVNRS